MKKCYLDEVIHTARLTLKKHELDEATTIFKVVDKNRERLGKYLPWVEEMKTVEDERKYIEMTLNDWEYYRQFDYSIFDKKGKFIGNFGLLNIKWDFSACCLGYWLDEESEGKGYVSEIVQYMEKYLFDLGFYRIEIHVRYDNAKSIKVAESLGYTKDAILRESIFHLGRRWDGLIYSKLRTDKNNK